MHFYQCYWQNAILTQKFIAGKYSSNNSLSVWCMIDHSLESQPSKICSLTFYTWLEHSKEICLLQLPLQMHLFSLLESQALMTNHRDYFPIKNILELKNSSGGKKPQSRKQKAELVSVCYLYTDSDRWKKEKHIENWSYFCDM